MPASSLKTAVTWADHDPDVRAMLRDCLVSRRSIIGAICCHLFDVLYLIKQRPHLDGSPISFSVSV